PSPAAEERALDKISGSRQLQLEERDRVEIVWPVAKPTSLLHGRADLFEISHSLTVRDAALPGVLTRLFLRGSHGSRRVTDAVAGLEAYAGHSRRCALLVLGDEDRSHYSVETVRRYLERMRVPLYVWSVKTILEPAPSSSWGEVEDVSTFKNLQRAFSRLKNDL